jgi:hypothetical protein
MLRIAQRAGFGVVPLFHNARAGGELEAAVSGQPLTRLTTL